MAIGNERKNNSNTKHGRKIYIPTNRYLFKIKTLLVDDVSDQ